MDAGSRTDHKITFGSLFAGIGGLDLGLERAGMECRWQVEIDDYATRVLEKRWPDVARFRDVRDCGAHNLEPVDLICGGFPCQDVSIAGKRAGLEGKRSTLWSEFARIVREVEPRWVLAENVPGLLSSDDGRFFGTVLGELAAIGYDAEWRVLDARHFGVAQRRRRVFIVGHLGGPPAKTVLFQTDEDFLAPMAGRLVSSAPATRRSNGGLGGSGDSAVVGTLKAAGVDTMSRVAYLAVIDGEDVERGGMRGADGIPDALDGGMNDGHESFGNHVQDTFAGHGTRIGVEARPVGGPPAGLSRAAREAENGYRVHAVESRGVRRLVLLARMSGAFPIAEDESGMVATKDRRQWAQGFGGHTDMARARLDGGETLDARTDRGTGRESPGSAPNRAKRYKALGNAVVPQVAEWIGRGIMEATWTPMN